MTPGGVGHSTCAVVQSSRLCPGGCLITGKTTNSCLYCYVCGTRTDDRRGVVLDYHIKNAGRGVARAISKCVSDRCRAYREGSAGGMAPGGVGHSTCAVVQSSRLCPGGCLITGKTTSSCLYCYVCGTRTDDRRGVVLDYHIKNAGRGVA